MSAKPLFVERNAKTRRKHGLAPYPLQALVMVYIASKQRRGVVSKNTARSYGYYLRDVCRQLPSDPRKVKRKHIQATMEADLSPAMLQKRLGTLRNLFKWLVVEGYVSSDPTEGVEAPKQPALLPRALMRDDSAIVGEAIDSGRLTPRMALMLSLMWSEGLRRIELHRLTVADIDQRARVVRIRGKFGRGEVTRQLPLSERTERALKAHLATAGTAYGKWQAPVKFTPAGPLFPSLNNPKKPVGADRVGVLVSEALYELGIKHGPHDGVSGHVLRHTMATEALENGAPLPVVQRFLGHSSPQTTHRYTMGAVFDLRQVHDLRG